VLLIQCCHSRCDGRAGSVALEPAGDSDGDGDGAGGVSGRGVESSSLTRRAGSAAGHGRGAVVQQRLLPVPCLRIARVRVRFAPQKG
jgi:hypothetical protein